MVVGALLTIYSFYVQAIPGVTLVTPEIEIGWAFCTINCVLLTAGTFLAFTCIGNSKSPRLITEMSKLSYGMYLMHIFWLGLWVTVFKHDLALPTVRHTMYCGKYIYLLLCDDKDYLINTGQ